MNNIQTFEQLGSIKQDYNEAQEKFSHRIYVCAGAGCGVGPVDSVAFTRICRCWQRIVHYKAAAAITCAAFNNKILLKLCVIKPGKINVGGLLNRIRNSRKQNRGS